MKVEQLQIVKDTGQCVGCTACASVCPKKAIKIDSCGLLGFYTPTIDMSICVNCGLCVDSCPILNEKNTSQPQKAYYGWALDDDIRKQSSSGGVFSILAKKVLKENGVVFGAAYDSELKKVIHTSTNSVSLDLLMGSKYVQSDLGVVFVEVKKNLENNRLTLFVGTPCQVAGLFSFLGDIDYPNLVTCDFICHGVPGPNVFSKYIQIVEKKVKSSVISYSFRNKKQGWRNSCTEILFKNGKKISHRNIFDMYFQGFVDELFLNESCYMCKMDNVFNADIRLSDFWGYSSFGIQNDEKGMSLLLVQTQRGEEIVREIGKDVFLKELPADLAIKSQTYTLESHKKNYAKHKDFMEFVKKHGIKGALNKKIGYTPMLIFFNKMQRFGIKKVCKRLINRFKW